MQELISFILLPTYREETFQKYLEEGWYSLEQYIGFEGRQAFNYYCSLHQV